MSAQLARKSLEIVESEGFKRKDSKNKSINVLSANQNHQQTGNRVNIISTKKLTISEVKKSQKTKNEIYKSNLKKLKQIKKACEIKLDKTIAKQIIQRAVTGKPVPTRSKPKKQQKTVFTEEDFQKFEREYTGE